MFSRETQPVRRPIFLSPALEDYLNLRGETRLLATVLCLLIQTGVAFPQSADNAKSPVQNTWVMKPTLTGHTLPLYQIKDKYVSRGYKDAEEVKRPGWLQGPAPIDPKFTDKAIQQVYGPQVGLTFGLSIDGIGQGLTGPNGTYSVDSVPPDTDMAAGTTQIVSLDNTAFAVFDKVSGAVTAGPYNTNVLWSALGTGSTCEQENDGDGIVKFDQLAQRWIITQFALGPSDTGLFADCFAISETADATGSWAVFQFVPSSNGYFPDYPKLGIWPNVYSMTFDMFNSSGTSYEGAGICGINRTALLAGTVPPVVCAQLASTDYALLPVDLDGSTYPPSANTSALYIENSDAATTSTSLYMYRATYDFTANTVSVSSKITITVSQYDNATCSNTQRCVPQPAHTGSLPAGEIFASESKLDTLAAHEMWRAAYRNFGSYESLTVSGTVLPSGSGGTGSNTATRWYEIRTPFGTPTVYQQSTYSPDTGLYRWMGSIAQDHQGNMALGYSGSSSTVFPSVYVTGRLNGDPLNTMESEYQLFAGLNSQVNITGYAYGYRWGDYTAMMIDPNDCTFWYTGEYLKQAGEFNWSTRLFSFSFPGCTSTAAITSPVPGATLTGSGTTFLWAASNVATAYWIDIGSAAGGNNYYSSGSLSTTTFSAAVTTLPTNGTTVYATLYSLIGGVWSGNAYTYAAFNAGAVAGVLTTPTPGTMLAGSTVIFDWTAGSGATAYWMDIGSAAGGNNYYSSGNLGNALTTTVNGLPRNGTTVYVTLYSLVGGAWTPKAYTYQAFSASAAEGVLTTPTPGSTLIGSTVTFDWTAGSGATAYWMDIGSSAGGNNYYSSGNLGKVLTTTVYGLPTDGSTINVTLYTLIGGSWCGNAYTYTALNATSGVAVMTTPTPGSILTSNSVTFTWRAGTGAAAYWLDVGSTAGGNNYYSSGNLGNVLTTTAPNLPAIGSMLYATLYSLVGGQWVSNSYTYTAAPGAVMQTPVPGTTLSGTSATFNWTAAGTGATGYELTVGSTYGGSNIYSSGPITALTTPATLPANGSIIYVTLYSYFAGRQLQNYYSYVSVSGP